MAETLKVVHPYPLGNPHRAAEQARGVHEAGLTGDTVYVKGDLVTVATGKVRKNVAAVAADVVGLAWGCQDYDEPFALSYWKERGVPLNRINAEDEIVFTYAGLFDAAAKTAVDKGEQRQVLFDATEKCLTIRAGTTTPAVKMLRVARGAVGDTNVEVVCQLLPGAIF